MQLAKQHRVTNGTDGVLALIEKLSYQTVELAFFVHEKQIDAS